MQTHDEATDEFSLPKRVRMYHSFSSDGLCLVLNLTQWKSKVLDQIPKSALTINS